jgi:hypothetical protein
MQKLAFSFLDLLPLERRVIARSFGVEPGFGEGDAEWGRRTLKAASEAHGLHALSDMVEQAARARRG